jgi:hypothetical protein
MNVNSNELDHFTMYYKCEKINLKNKFFCGGGGRAKNFNSRFFVCYFEFMHAFKDVILKHNFIFSFKRSPINSEILTKIQIFFNKTAN